MRVTPDRQTLILAGEMPSTPTVSGFRGMPASQRVTVFSARVDAVVTETEYVPDPGVIAYEAQSAPTIPRAYAQYAAASRGTVFSGGADAYTRTQDLAERQPIIDTYA